jgi:hypothetical protein
MQSMMLEVQLKAQVPVEICTNCEGFWFDNHEEIGLSPGSVLSLMKIIGDQSALRKPALANTLFCPRCSGHLNLTHDMLRATRFSYWRCPQHGRFMGFFDFLREKNFIRPMTQGEIDELRQKIQTVNCSNCGAAIDLAAASVCPHCGSPISILDTKQSRELLAQLQKAAQIGPADPDVSKLKEQKQ